MASERIEGEHGSDICYCSDYRSQHKGGKCSVSRCECPGFLFSHVSKDRTHWEKYHGEILNPKESAGTGKGSDLTERKEVGR